MPKTTLSLPDHRSVEIARPFEIAPWLAQAFAELGVTETPGAQSTPAISRYFEAIGAKRHDDETPWCAAFVGAMLERSQYTSTRSLMARSCLRLGMSISSPRIGAVAVFSRGADPALGHVGFVVGTTGQNLLILGGNQGDAVSIAAYPKSTLLGLRWPTQQKTSAEPAASAPPAYEAAFNIALDHVLQMEGGYTNDPHDPGGPTNFGITLHDLRNINKTASQEELHATLLALTRSDVAPIYHKLYWRPASCPLLPVGIAIFHFDAAVNHGVGRANRLLQTSVGAEPDGEIGPQTEAAIAAAPVSAIVEMYAEHRRARYRALPHFWRFGRGWLARVDKTLALAARHVSSPERIQMSDTPAQNTATSNARSYSEPPPHRAAVVVLPEPKWWPHSMTIWGVIITVLTTVAPTVGHLFGVDLTADMIKRLGEELVRIAQAFGSVFGILLTITGRARAASPLGRRPVSLKL